MLPITYTPAAEKYFRKLKDNKLKILYREAIIKIRKNPHIGDSKKGNLKGIYCIDLYYNRTNYELAYRISQLENGDIEMADEKMKEKFLAISGILNS